MTRDRSNAPRVPTPAAQESRAAPPIRRCCALLDLAPKGIPTLFDRFDQQKRHCKHGLAGVCCQLCHMGPCQVTARAPRGTCGADADVIVARNILRWMAGATASHGSRGREAILALKAAAEGRFPQRNPGGRQGQGGGESAGAFDDNATVENMAGAIADVLLEDLGRAVPGDHRILRAMAPAERIAGLGSLGYSADRRLSGGVRGDAPHRRWHRWRLAQSMQQFLRTGLAFSWSSVSGSAIATDCLYGPPVRSHIETNVGTLDAGAVNIAIHGHSPVLATAIVEARGRAGFDRPRQGKRRQRHQVLRHLLFRPQHALPPGRRPSAVRTPLAPNWSWQPGPSTCGSPTCRTSIPASWMWRIVSTPRSSRPTTRPGCRAHFAGLRPSPHQPAGRPRHRPAHRLACRR